MQTLAVKPDFLTGFIHIYTGGLTCVLLKSFLQSYMVGMNTIVTPLQVKFTLWEQETQYRIFRCQGPARYSEWEGNLCHLLLKTRIQVWDWPRPLQRWRRLISFQHPHENGHHEYTKGGAFITLPVVQLYLHPHWWKHTSLWWVFPWVFFLEGRTLLSQKLHLPMSWWLEQGFVT